VYLLVRTSQSNLHVGEAARTQAFVDAIPLLPSRRLLQEPGYIGQEFEVDIHAGQTLRLEKIACLYSSRDAAISEPGVAAQKAMARAGRFEAVQSAHVIAWKHLWRRFDLHLQPARARF